MPAPADVADDHVQLAVGAERDRPAVVALLRLAGVLLQRADPGEVAVERQRRPVPDEPVDAVPEQRVCESTFVSVTVVLSVQKRYTPGFAGKPDGARSRAAALGAEVDVEVEHGSLLRAVDDPLDAAGVLLEREDVVAADEGDARRQGEPGGDRPDTESSCPPSSARLPEPKPATRAEDDDRAESREHSGSDAISRHTHRRFPLVRIRTSTECYGESVEPVCATRRR